MAKRLAPYFGYATAMYPNMHCSRVITPAIMKKNPNVGTIQWISFFDVQANKNMPVGTSNEPRRAGISLRSGGGKVPLKMGLEIAKWVTIK